MGRFSYFCGWYAVGFVLLMIPILNFPQFRGKNLTPALMNWTCLVYYGSMFLAIAWYFIYAHKIFKGPKSNITNSVIPNYEELGEQVDIAEKIVDAQVEAKTEGHVSLNSIDEANSGFSGENLKKGSEFIKKENV